MPKTYAHKAEHRDKQGTKRANECKKRARRLLALTAGTVYAQGWRDQVLTVTDLLTDLRHACDLRGYDFDCVLASAYEHYHAEKRGT